jgi:hypothetical protein
LSEDVFEGFLALLQGKQQRQLQDMSLITISGEAWCSSPLFLPHLFGAEAPLDRGQGRCVCR